VLHCLETPLPAAGLLIGGLMTADISTASFFRSAEYAGYRVDAGRWPKTAGFVARVLALPPFVSTALRG
jgi:hypothetical protein